MAGIQAHLRFLVKHFGKDRLVADLDPEDFAELRAKMARRWGPVTLGNLINRMRVVFKFASDNRLIASPVVYGASFKRPSKKHSAWTGRGRVPSCSRATKSAGSFWGYQGRSG
jgi:hypothetical protein